MQIHEVLMLVDPRPEARLKGIARLAGRHGWRVRTEPRLAPPDSWQGDGVLVMLDGTEALTDFVRSVRRRGIPVVDLTEDCPAVDVPRVTGDNLLIGRLAAEHFNDRDFRHAAFFSLRRNHTRDLRLKGFREVWCGKEPETWFWPDAADGAADDWNRLDAWLEGKLRKAPKPLAVFCGNDYDAVQVLAACQRLSLKVPEGVSILGVDDDPLICEHQRTPLSSVSHDLERVGYAAAAALERLMSGGTLDNRHLHVKPRGIVTRNSTETFAVCDRELQPAINYITRNLSRPLGAAQIAAALKMPRIRLDRLFASRLGHSVGAETARRRLARATALLENTEMPLAEIAAECGYCHASFFIRTFKKATGLTPLAWRKRRRTERSGR